jgi:hypothetical protein
MQFNLVKGGERSFSGSSIDVENAGMNRIRLVAELDRNETSHSHAPQSWNAK